ncbi:permease-like cell division protein FtsX [Candidatus Parcubacteria bacterium]|nr:permease-like cell division protein FtsX [Candidatus Parcubacteria bacterium]
MFSSFFRIIKFAFQNFYRNFWLAIVTITILVVTLFSITALIILNVISTQAVKSIEDKIDISIYFKTEAEDIQIIKTRSELLSLKEVKEVNLIDREQAMVFFKERHKDDPTILESVEILKENPFNSVLVVKAKNSEYYPEILKVLDKEEYNQIIEKKDFSDHKIIINKISIIKTKIEKIGLFVIAFFALIAALIVFNTVRIAIYTHRSEIKIMKLVGASNWFIRAPFLVEEFFYAIISFLILIAVFYPAIDFLQPHLNYFLEYDFDLISYFKANFALIFGLEFLTIIIINALSSFVAMKKYLKA